MRECEGDCDSDSDCSGSLVCFDRSNTEAVPGCSGTGEPGNDYCIQPESRNLRGQRRTESLLDTGSSFAFGTKEEEEVLLPNKNTLQQEVNTTTSNFTIIHTTPNLFSDDKLQRRWAELMLLYPGQPGLIFDILSREECEERAREGEPTLSVRPEWIETHINNMTGVQLHALDCHYVIVR